MVVIIALYLLNYVRSEQSNVFQTIVGYAAFAYNISKYTVKIFYWMKLAISYESIYCTIGTNANVVEKEMIEMILTYLFFIS